MKKFNDWFDEQFGKRPNISKVSDMHLRGIFLEGIAAAEELKSREIYDAVRTAALYAWQVGK